MVLAGKYGTLLPPTAIIFLAAIAEISFLATGTPVQPEGLTATYRPNTVYFSKLSRHGTRLFINPS